jgi:hypothetical protein
MQAPGVDVLALADATIILWVTAFVPETCPQCTVNANGAGRNLHKPTADGL